MNRFEVLISEMCLVVGCTGRNEPYMILSSINVNMKEKNQQKRGEGYIILFRRCY